MKKIIFVMSAILSATVMNAKTLIAYYSYTNNVERIVNELCTQIDADVIEIEPAEKGLNYAANNYALGTQLLNAIRANPNDASSYPPIDKVDVDMSQYDMVIIAAPLWWSQMAAPFQTFLFHYGSQMAGKRIGVIVSSASSGISGVVADAKRLIPDGNFVEPNLWIRSSQTSDARRLLAAWLEDIHYKDLVSSVTSVTDDKDDEIEIGEDGLLIVRGDFNLLSLYDMSGSKMAETSGRQLSMANQPAGTYVLKAVAPNRVMTKKVHITR